MDRKGSGRRRCGLPKCNNVKVAADQLFCQSHEDEGVSVARFVGSIKLGGRSTEQLVSCLDDLGITECEDLVEISEEEVGQLGLPPAADRKLRSALIGVGNIDVKKPSRRSSSSAADSGAAGQDTAVVIKEGAVLKDGGNDRFEIVRKLGDGRMGDASLAPSRP